VPDSVLSDGTIRRLVEEGAIVIKPWNPELVQPASIDLRLGDTFRVFHNHRAAVIDLKDGPPKGLTEEVVATPSEAALPIMIPGARAKAPSEERLRELLENHKGNVTAVARELRKDRVQVHRWLKRYDLSPDEFRDPSP